MILYNFIISVNKNKTLCRRIWTRGLRFTCPIFKLLGYDVDIRTNRFIQTISQKISIATLWPSVIKNISLDVVSYLILPKMLLVCTMRVTWNIPAINYSLLNMRIHYLSVAFSMALISDCQFYTQLAIKKKCHVICKRVLCDLLKFLHKCMYMSSIVLRSPVLFIF